MAARSRHPHRWTAQILALALLIAGWGVPLAFPHDAIDDLLCAAGARGSGEQAVSAPDTIRQAEHCAVCHSLRSLRTAGLDDSVTSVALVPAHALPSPSLLGHRPPDSQRLPARAPPPA